MSIQHAQELADGLLPFLLDAQSERWPEAPCQETGAQGTLAFRLDTGNGLSFVLLLGASIDIPRNGRKRSGIHEVRCSDEACDVADLLIEAIGECWDALSAEQFERSYPEYLSAIRNATRGPVVDTVELRSAYDEGAPVEYCAQRILAGRSVLWSDRQLSVEPCETPLPRGWDRS